MDDIYLIINSRRADEYIAQLSASISQILLQSILKVNGHFSVSNTTQEDKLLSRQEAAELLKVSLSTLNSRMKKRQLPYKRIGRRILFSKTELLKSMEQFQVVK